MSLKILRTLPIFLFLIAITSCAQKNAGKNELEVKDFQSQLAASADGQLLDVRTPEEYQGGHLKNAININFNDDAFTANVVHLDKSKPVFVYCLSGGRSGKAAAQMRNSGFKQVYEMKGGMLAWRAAALPEEKQGGELATSGMNGDDFKKTVTADELVLVDFNATWCGPCKKLAPILDELAEDHKGKLKLVKIDIDQNKELAAGMNITAIPLVQLYKGGNKVWEQLGLVSKETIDAAIKQNQ